MTDCKTEACISCSVKNCVYHTKEDTCSAGKIHVGNMTACTTGETFCDTFEVR
ncbi:MAG: DUF1540 domain-containing protein [Clostridia bacterium]|nr:DUF1540 domain-containing protein [Clostridia bacterium]